MRCAPERRDPRGRGPLRCRQRADSTWPCRSCRPLSARRRATCHVPLARCPLQIIQWCVQEDAKSSNAWRWGDSDGGRGVDRSEVFLQEQVFEGQLFHYVEGFAILTPREPAAELQGVVRLAGWAILLH